MLWGSKEAARVQGSGILGAKVRADKVPSCPPYNNYRKPTREYYQGALVDVIFLFYPQAQRVKFLFA
jgi:hypothetical protein